MKHHHADRVALTGATLSPMDVPTDAAERRRWYLDESLRIAVWEMIFGSGSRRRVDELLAEGASWHTERPSR